MQLYTVTFTTKVVAAKYDAKGKLVSSHGLGKPIKLEMLPYQTAMSYSGCENFKIEKYVMQGNGKPARDNSVGNGTKRTSMARSSDAVVRSKPVEKKPSFNHAAATGNLGAALNV